MVEVKPFYKNHVILLAYCQYVAGNIVSSGACLYGMRHMGSGLIRRYPHFVGGSGLSLFGEKLSVRLAIGWVDDVLMPPVLRSQIGFWPDWRERHGAPGCHRKV
jgi:hypothetical protein